MNPVGLSNSFPTGTGDDSDQFRNFINKSLDSTGERERLKDLLRLRLNESGWRGQLKEQCRSVIKSRGLEAVTVDDLVDQITPTGRRLVPDMVKKELLEEIRSFIEKVMTESAVTDDAAV